MNYALTELKEQQPILRKYHSKMLRMISTKVAGALSALEELKKKGCETGELHLLKHGECSSFVYNQFGFRLEKHDQTDLLWLSKLGCIEIRLHRQPMNIKQVTICRQNARWYAVIACDTKPIFRFVHPNRSVGIDVGITKFVYDSDNHFADNPLFLTRMSKPLRRVQRKVSRRKKGSNNYKKAVSWLQRLHMRIANKRKDFLHKLSNYYAERYDAIFLEHLRLNNMNKNHRLARHIMDSSWGMFKQLLAYKANRIVDVDPYNTTIECSKCGNKVPKTLAIRTHEFDVCGAVLDRDHNSSMVIEDRGRVLLNLPMRHREVTPVEILRRVAEAGTSPRALAVDS